MIIDTHAHVSDIWYEPAESLLFQMDRAGVDRALLVQILGQYDNHYILDCVKRWPDRFNGVVAVDPDEAQAAAQLYELAERGAFAVRLRPDSRSPGEDPLALWRAAAEAGLAVSCAGSMTQLVSPEFAAVLHRFPSLPVLLEHAAGLARHDAVDDGHTRQLIEDLSTYPNVYVKLPGLGQVEARAMRIPLGKRPISPGAGVDRLRSLINAFGADRVMWGSDFPVVSSREGYGNALAWIREALAFSAEAERAVFGSTARTLLAGSSNRNI